MNPDMDRCPTQGAEHRHARPATDIISLPNSPVITMAATLRAWDHLGRRGLVDSDGFVWSVLVDGVTAA